MKNLCEIPTIIVSSGDSIFNIRERTSPTTTHRDRTLHYYCRIDKNDVINSNAKNNHSS